MGGVLDNRLDYVNRLSYDRGDLLYEEMHKLFGLADEIWALKALGLPFSRSLYAKFEKGLRYRFEREPENAHLAAEQNFNDWNRDRWWYKNNLKN